MTPTVGRSVHYRLSGADALVINQRRGPWGAPVDGRHGSQAAEGDVLAATVVRVSGTEVNLQVQLDGDDHYWARSRAEGTEPGQWAWPPRG